MKVNELITWLAQFDPQADVLLANNCCGTSALTEDDLDDGAELQHAHELGYDGLYVVTGPVVEPHTSNEIG